MQVWRASLIVAMALWATSPVAAQDTAGVGTIRGRLLGSDGTPARNVAACAPATGQCAISDGEGRFELTLRPGRYDLELVPPGAPGIIAQTIETRAGQETVVEITLPALDRPSETVTVTAGAFTLPDSVTTSGQLVSSASIAASAGALQDVSRYVRSLPGVVPGTDDFRNDLIVRGGSPLENLFIVDNIEIPNINSFATFASAGGSVSLLDTQLIEDVTFLSGGFPAPFGTRASSVLQVALRDGSRTRVAGRATVGFAGAGTVVEGPLGSGRKGSWIVSARRSFLDLFTDDTGIGGVPVLYTVNGKLVFEPTPRDRIWVVNLTGVDDIRLGLTEDSELDEGLSTVDIRYDGSRSATGANWQRVFDRGVGLLGLTYSRAAVGQQVSDLLRNGVPAPDTPVEAQLAGGAVVFRERSREAETTLKYDLTLKVPPLRRLQAGGSVRRVRLEYDTASPFGSDSPFFPVADSNPFVIGERLTAFQGAAYVQATQAVTAAANLTGGLRVDRFAIADATRVSPRLGADYTLTPRVSLRASYGQYHQTPQSLFLLAYPQNRSLEPFRADHYVGGVVVELAAATRLTVEAYRKRYRDYPVSSQIPALSLANTGDTFAIADALFPMINDGRGTASGVEAHVTRAPRSDRRLSGEANLAFSRSRYAGTDQVLRPGAYDHPVVANVDGRYRLSPRWTVAGRTTYLSGRPITPIDEAASRTQRRAVFDIARVNAERAPAYFRLDVRVDRTFRIADREVSVFAGVQNVTNRRNVAGYRWDRRNNVLRTSEQLGLFPILGLEWPF